MAPSRPSFNRGVGARWIAVPGRTGDAREVFGAETADETLMVEVARGNRDALGVLYDRHAGLALALARRILGDLREAEDLVHDVFVEAWQRAGDYDPSRGSVKTWLLVRIRSRCLDRRKSPSHTRRVALAEPPAIADDPGRTDPSRRLDGARLAAALAGLSEEQRAVLLLGYFDGLSSSEIAERLGIPLGTVKSRVHAAMARLREQLGEGAPGP